MPRMTDPSDALAALQDAFNRGRVQLQPGVADPSLFVHIMRDDGPLRNAYVRFEGKTVAAMAILAMAGRKAGKLCFDLGYAVPAAYRNQGRAKKIVRDAIAEMRRGLSTYGNGSFNVEAVVGLDNVASKHVAAATISSAPELMTDGQSGLPALRYVLEVKI
ncbi:MAG TPA: GNAT family N-acetyltransferase [Hyphomonadaceae bacterium]|nr:GNAT family N-acetyltransferase [Hyphomonadaceae bacterium]